MPALNHHVLQAPASIRTRSQHAPMSRTDTGGAVQVPGLSTCRRRQRQASGRCGSSAQPAAARGQKVSTGRGPDQQASWALILVTSQSTPWVQHVPAGCVHCGLVRCPCTLGNPGDAWSGVAVPDCAPAGDSAGSPSCGQATTRAACLARPPLGLYSQTMIMLWLNQHLRIYQHPCLPLPARLRICVAYMPSCTLSSLWMAACMAVKAPLASPSHAWGCPALLNPQAYTLCCSGLSAWQLIMSGLGVLTPTREAVRPVL